MKLDASFTWSAERGMRVRLEVWPCSEKSSQLQSSILSRNKFWTSELGSGSQSFQSLVSFLSFCLSLLRALFLTEDSFPLFRCKNLFCFVLLFSFLRFAISFFLSFAFFLFNFCRCFFFSLVLSLLVFFLFRWDFFLFFCFCFVCFGVFKVRLIFLLVANSIFLPGKFCFLKFYD